MTPLRLPYEAEPIETERLLLRPLSLDDAEDHARYQGDAEAVRYLRWPMRTPEESRAHLAVRLPSDRLAADGQPASVLTRSSPSGSTRTRRAGSWTGRRREISTNMCVSGWSPRPVATPWRCWSWSEA